MSAVPRRFRLQRSRAGCLSAIAAAALLLAAAGAAFAVPSTGGAPGSRQLLRGVAPPLAGSPRRSGTAAAAVEQLTAAPLSAADVPSLWRLALEGLVGLGAIGGALYAAFGRTMALKGFAGLAGMYVIMSLNEYVVHRYYQHLGLNKTGLSRWVRKVFNLQPMKSSGHVEHHAETMDDMSLDMRPDPILDSDPFRGTAFSWTVSAGMTVEIALQSYPFLVFLCGWSWKAATIALFAAMFLHAAVWQTLHPNMHELPDPPMSYGMPGWSMAWLRKTRYFRFLYANHEGHHRVPGSHGNYNVCFPLADHLLGTYAGYVPAKANATA